MLIAPLTEGFGAEIVNFNLDAGVSPDDIERLQAAFLDRHLLVFRADAPISPERQVEVTRWFGPVLAEGPTAWTTLDNADPAGRNALRFHSDICFAPKPLLGLSFVMTEIPRGGTSTTFVSGALAWRALPSDLRDELSERVAAHVFDAAVEFGFDWPRFDTRHPVRLRHPKSGREILFVNETHVTAIDGLAPARSAAILPILFAALYTPERRYEHDWRPGDLVVFDNLAVQHARTCAADPANGRRVIRRVQIGEVGFAEQLEAARRARALSG